MLKMIRVLLVFSLITLTLSACIKASRLSIQQGNIIPDASIAKLHIGMSREEVIHEFGYPVLDNVFDGDRLVYVYTFKPGYHRIQKRRLIIYFRGGRVINFFADHTPVSFVGLS